MRALKVWPRLGTGCWAELHSRATGTNLFSGAKRGLDLKEEAAALTRNLDFTFSSPHLCLRWELLPFESLKLLKFLRQQVDLFDLSVPLLWQLTKKILVLFMSPLVGNFKKKNTIYWKSSKTWFLKFVWQCVYVQDKLYQKDRWTPLLVVAAAAAQPQIAITHLHAKQELIPTVANEPHTTER